jgi:hypothetical protein
VVVAHEQTGQRRHENEGCKVFHSIALSGNAAGRQSQEMFGTAQHWNRHRRSAPNALLVYPRNDAATRKYALEGQNRPSRIAVSDRRMALTVSAAALCNRRPVRAAA